MRTFPLLLLISLHLAAQEPVKIQVLSHPRHLVIDSKDNLYVTMKYGIARVSPEGQFTDLRKLEGGNRIDMSFENGGLVIDSRDNLIAVIGASIYKITIRDDKIQVAPMAGNALNGKYGIEDGQLPAAKLQEIGLVAIDKKDNLYITQNASWIKDAMKEKHFITDPFIADVPANKAARRFFFIRKITADGLVSTLKTSDNRYVLVNSPTGLTVDPAGNIYYASPESRSVERINAENTTFGHVAGKPYKRQYCPVYVTGDTSKAELFAPGPLVLDKSGDLVYSDTRSHRISRIANGKVTTLAGANIIDPCNLNVGGRAQEGHRDGKALTALFNFPRGLVFDSKGNLFIADQQNMCIRKLSPEGIVSSFTTFDRSQAMIGN